MSSVLLLMPCSDFDIRIISRLTLGLLFGGLGIGIAGGKLIAVLRYNNIAGFISGSFVSVIRGTPLILQLSFVYFAIPGFMIRCLF